MLCVSLHPLNLFIHADCLVSQYDGVLRFTAHVIRRHLAFLEVSASLKSCSCVLIPLRSLFRLLFLLLHPPPTLSQSFSPVRCVSHSAHQSALRDGIPLAWPKAFLNHEPRRLKVQLSFIRRGRAGPLGPALDVGVRTSSCSSFSRVQAGRIFPRQ